MAPKTQTETVSKALDDGTRAILKASGQLGTSVSTGSQRLIPTGTVVTIYKSFDARSTPSKSKKTQPASSDLLYYYSVTLLTDSKVWSPPINEKVGADDLAPKVDSNAQRFPLRTDLPAEAVMRVDKMFRQDGTVYTVRRKEVVLVTQGPLTNKSEKIVGKYDTTGWFRIQKLLRVDKVAEQFKGDLPLSKDNFEIVDDSSA